MSKTLPSLSTKSSSSEDVVLSYQKVVPNKIMARIRKPEKGIMSLAVSFTSLKMILNCLNWFMLLVILKNMRKLVTAASPWWPLDPFPVMLQKINFQMQMVFDKSAMLKMSKMYSWIVSFVVA